MEKTKEDYIMAMNLHERNLYAYAVHTINAPIDCTKRIEVPHGLIHAVMEAEKGNYQPLREQESNLREISLRY